MSISTITSYTFLGQKTKSPLPKLKLHLPSGESGLCQRTQHLGNLNGRVVAVAGMACKAVTGVKIHNPIDSC